MTQFLPCDRTLLTFLFTYSFYAFCLYPDWMGISQPLSAISQTPISHTLLRSTDEQHTDEQLVSQDLQPIPFRLNVTRLDAYEDQLPPLGTPPGIVPAVGHGVIRLRIENLTPTAVNFQIHRIEIRASCGSVVMSQPGIAIALGGLQILEPGYHLTNQAGYQTTKQVKAIVVYEFAGRTHTAESDFTEVSVNR